MYVRAEKVRKLFNCEQAILNFKLIENYSFPQHKPFIVFCIDLESPKFHLSYKKIYRTKCDLFVHDVSF